MSTVTVEVSQRFELAMKGLLLVKVTPHEVVVVTNTRTVEFVVLKTDPDAALVRVNVSAARRIVPLQVLPAYSVKDRVPLTGEPPAVVIVAESFGSQF